MALKFASKLHKKAELASSPIIAKRAVLSVKSPNFLFTMPESDRREEIVPKRTSYELNALLECRTCIIFKISLARSILFFPSALSRAHARYSVMARH